MSSVAPTAAALAAPAAFADVLRVGSYRRLWVSGLCVNSARWMDLVLLGWLSFQLTDSPFMVGLAAFARSAPLIVLPERERRQDESQRQPSGHRRAATGRPSSSTQIGETMARG